MLRALQRLSVLPLRFSFEHSSSSFEEPTCLRLFVARIRVWIFRQAPLAATGLHNLSFLRANPVHHLRWMVDFWTPFEKMYRT
ncbi:hypothetical protein CHARACLAT_022527 [Characodon lateralis]|uniref:Secreted protein n=1 Tax=Characodon lateralis TaxID=208331 RepID=A0ABU7F663_9TELE|nr:hypothetical protein [Characodon lateralis]